VDSDATPVQVDETLTLERGCPTTGVLVLSGRTPVAGTQQRLEVGMGRGLIAARASEI
jgi:hypothetical protein